MSNQYAYIPLSNAPLLNDADGYTVRIATYMPGLEPDMLDSNGAPIPNALELESMYFTPEQRADILSLDGLYFLTAEDYLARKTTSK